MSDALKIALAPAYVYGVAYVYELGFCDHLGVPHQFIRIDAGVLLHLAAALTSIGIILYFATTKVSSLLSSLGPFWRTHVSRPALFGVVALVLLCFNWSRLWWRLVLLLALSTIISPLVSALIRKPRTLSFRESFYLRLEQIASGPKSWYDQFIDRVGYTWGYWIPMVAAAVLFTSNTAGFFDAGHDVNYPTYRMDNRLCVVLRSSSSFTVSCGIDSSTHRLDGSFFLTDLTKDTDREYVMKPVGPLKPPEVRNRKTGERDATREDGQQRDTSNLDSSPGSP